MFKIGQKVVCVNANGSHHLIEGEIYTVTGTVAHIPKTVAIKEAKPNEGTVGFWEWRFRATVDNNWVEEVLHKILEEVEQDELVCVGG